MLHNKVEGAFGILAGPGVRQFPGGVEGRLREGSVPILREISAMCRCRIGRDVGEQGLELWAGSLLGILFLENDRQWPWLCLAVLVFTVVLHGFQEEQAQGLDTKRPVAQLLLEMVLDRLTDHRP